MESAIALDEVQTSRPLSLAEQVETLLARLNPDVVVDRRRDERVAIPILFQLIPLDADRQPLEAEAKYVVGKNISRRGLSFFHDGPITFRRALVLLDHPGLGSFRAEIDVNWCRFARPGWYESGGRLIRLAGDDEGRPTETVILREARRPKDLGNNPAASESDCEILHSAALRSE